jgi:hypothetical protein
MDREADIKVWCNVRGNDFDFFLRRVEPYRHDLTVCCESTFNWYWLADACMDADIEFVLGHALYLGSVRGASTRTIKRTARSWPTACARIVCRRDTFTRGRSGRRACSGGGG